MTPLSWQNAYNMKLIGGGKYPNLVLSIVTVKLT